MVKNNSLTVQLDHEQDKNYLPEQFGLTRPEVYASREQIIYDRSEGTFLYTWKNRNDHLAQENGGYYFAQVANSDLYTHAVTDVESGILSANTDLGKRLSSKKHHIELGPGVGHANKFRRCIYPNYLQKTGKSYVHIGRDVASSITDACAKEYDPKYTPGLSFVGLNSDRRKKDVVEQITDQAYYRLGGSIGNYDESEIIQILRGLSSDSSRRGCDIVVTHFLRPEGSEKKNNIEKIKQQYQTPEVKAFIFKGFEALGIDTSKLEFAVEYEENEYGPDRIKVGAQAKEAISIDLGQGNTITKEAGSYLRAISSRRYSTLQFATLAERAGCTLADSYTDPERRMAVALLKTSHKPFSLSSKIAAGVGSALVVLFGGVKIGSMIEQFNQEQKQKAALEETFVNQVNARNGILASVLRENEQEARKILYILEHRYGAKLNIDQQQHIIALFYDWVKLYPKYAERRRFRGGGGMMWSTDFYDPNVISRFVREHKNILTSLGVSTIPNHALLANMPALRNTYFYTGPRQEFHEVDEKLPDHIAVHVSETSTGGFDHAAYPCGVKYIEGKPYVVISYGKDAPYVLDEVDHTLQMTGLSAVDYVIDIIQRGEVPLLAEKIKNFLNAKYGDKSYTYALNGSAEIARYLTDLYASGYDLGYLLAGDTQRSDLMMEDPVLKFFVHAYVLPALREKLSTGSWRMHDLRRDEIDKDQANLVQVRATIERIYTYLDCYLPDSDQLTGSLKSAVMKYALLDHAWEFLDDDRDIRCRLTEHAEEINKEGNASIQMFPDYLGEYIADGKYHAEDAFVDIRPSSVEESYMRMATNGSWYTTFGGNRIYLGLYAKNGRRGNRLVGKEIKKEMVEDIWTKYQTGQLGKVRSRGERGVSYEITDKSGIVNNFLNKIPFSSAAAHEAVKDYKMRKIKKAAYEKKKTLRSKN